jgi:hypothetical protein
MTRNEVADQIVHTTARIETIYADGSSGSGTGFFVQFCAQNNRSVPAIVTNRHVVNGAVHGAIHFTRGDGEGRPVFGEHMRVPLAHFGSAWVPHPNPIVDLVALPMAQVLQHVLEHGERPHYKSWLVRDFADDTYFSELTAIEDILMVGYPNGLWDSKNNLPIVRRGITATPAYVDFEGRPEFVIDCACVPGSSGSPVIRYSAGVHRNKGSVSIGGVRARLLGVLYAGPFQAAEGEIRIVPVPIGSKPIVFSKIPINLGYCIKVTELLAFEKHFAELMERELSTKLPPPATAA